MGAVITVLFEYFSKNNNNKNNFLHLFQTILVSLHQNSKPSALGCTEDDWVTVTSVSLYANRLHFAPFR